MKTLTLSQLKGILQARVDEADSLRALARELRVSPSHVTNFLNGSSNIGPKLARALGYRPVVVFAPVKR